MLKFQLRYRNIDATSTPKKASNASADGNGQGQNGAGIPDATVGFCAFDLWNEPWTSKPELVENDRVKLFDKRLIDDILNDCQLLGPYASKPSEGTPIFAFALWEAKSRAGSDHQALAQSYQKLIALLEWQRTVCARAKFDKPGYSPVVWFFSSVGSTWTVHGCFVKKDRDDVYSFVGLPLSIDRLG